MPSLVFAEDHQLQHAPHQLLREPALDQAPRAEVLLDVPAQDLVQLVVRRKRVLVGLVLPQLGGGWTRQDPRRDQVGRALAIEPPGESVHRRLG